ncbi:SgcJ/EcaC family oxidoreductase [Actinoallomurus sp. CA-142502]|uniref:SgcJ/EcaC family oxidoreductase n=1 Tax=Actinoallomurus sp. CA-142502 TaxID=3239885 RepID=UPI003D8CD619
MTSTVALSDEIKTVFDQVYAAWAAGDADAFAAVYTDDVTVAMPGVFNKGRTAVHEHMAAGFAGPLKGSRGVDQPLDIRVWGDTAIVVSRAGIVPAGETEVPDDREVRATWVLIRADGQWKVAAYTNTPANR